MAGPLKAIENGYFRTFNFSGRASRSEFWWFQLYATVVGALLFIDLSKGGTLIVWFSLLNILPNLSLTIRRLHDTGRSGFWLFISFVPVVGPIVLLIFYLMPSDRDRNEWGEPESRSQKHQDRFSERNAQSGYASLMRVPNVNAEHSETFEDARKREIHDYYRTRVLGQKV